jgi:hypothetical protein
MWSGEFRRDLFKDRFKVNVNRGGRGRKGAEGTVDKECPSGLV